MALFDCVSARIPFPELPGASFNFLVANLVTNLSAYVPEHAYVNHGPVEVTNASFCNVSLAYTHAEQNDYINVQVWLPTDEWNGRMMGIGGGGFHSGLYPENFEAMLGAVAEGYAAVSTDGGHTVNEAVSDWLLDGAGKVNFALLQDFASVSLNDAAIIGKSVVESFYGEPPQYSYWSGCSQGGRQGMMLAQRYPIAYDGIVASAPAINWGEILISGFWTQFVMNQLESYPQSCELDFLTRAAVAYCDGNDGVLDNLVSDIDACDFNAFDLVGSYVPCGEDTVHLSLSAAIVATAAWLGPFADDGRNLWTGIDVDSNLTSSLSVAAQCSPHKKCTGLPVVYSSDWIRLAIMKDPEFDLESLTYEEYVRIFRDSVEKYTSIIGTNDPNLAEFRDRGGKILTFHGLADPLIPSRGTRHYYESAAFRDPDLRSYYRLFEAPGLGHCWSPWGLYPSTIFDDMVAWVEEDRLPTVLPVAFTDVEGVQNERILCPYPERAAYDRDGDPALRESYFCSVEHSFHTHVRL